MDAIKYMTDGKGDNSGIWIDLKAIKKSIKGKKELAELMEKIEDIVGLELSKVKSPFLIMKQESKSSQERNNPYAITIKERAVKTLKKIPGLSKQVLQ